MPHWTKKFFIEEGNRWLFLMNQHWKYAPRQAKQIIKILKGLGLKKGKILELACGNGRICTNLAKRGFKVTGVDISPAYINDAIIKAKKNKVKVNYICGDIRYINKYIRGKFDVVISIFTAIGYYGKKTDEKIFKQSARLLRKKGIFMILNTMSREWLLSHFCSSLYDDAGRYIILHKPEYDKYHSIMHERWRFYRKDGNDFKFEAELPINLKIYSQCDLVEMAEKAGLKFAKAYDLLNTLELAKPDSRINMVFQKVDD